MQYKINISDEAKIDVNSEKNLIDIIAILHTRRNPKIWKKRVKK